MDWAYTLAGLVVGFVVGVTGMGGGSLMTPLLVLFFGIPAATAVGTDLIYASITKAGGAWVHSRKGNVNWKLVGWLAAGSLPTAAITALVLVTLGLREQHLQNLINGVLGVALGVLVTISSVGAGAIGMVALLWLYPHVPSVRLVGVDIAHAVPLTAVAGLGHFFMGSVDFVLLGSLLLGSLPGIYLGSHVSGVFPEYLLRPVLACMLMLIGGRLVF